MPEAHSPRAPIIGKLPAASHLHSGLYYSSGAGDHDSFGSTTGTLGAHRRVIVWHPFDGAPIGGLYRHETRPIFELAPALGTLQVDTNSLPPRWTYHALPFALLYDKPSLWHVRLSITLTAESNSRKPRGIRKRAEILTPGPLSSSPLEFPSIREVCSHSGL